MVSDVLGGTQKIVFCLFLSFVFIGRNWNELRAACYLFVRDMCVSIQGALRASVLYYRPRLIQIEKLAIRRGQSISG